LPFSKARSLGLVVPYRLEILILDSDSEDRKDEDSVSLMERALEERRRWLAKAVQEHVRQCGKAVVYSRTNERAAEFAAELAEAGDAPVYQVSGGRSKERDLAMKALREEDRCIVSNCRCLQEGVDVPSLELAVVADPKSSVIDIVQLAGRVMRNAPGKTCGTILAPIVKVSGCDKLYGTKGFDIALKVLDALQDHDEGLRAALQAARECYGYNGTLTAEEVEDALGGYVIVREAGEMTSASALCRQHVLTAAIRLSGNGSWDERFGELLAFKEAQGHCNVPSRYKPNPALGTWVDTVRSNRKSSKLAADRAERLNRVGLVWNIDEHYWEQKFEELLAFKEAHGHFNVPEGYKPNPALANWVSNTRQNSKTGKLAADREERLNCVGFVWNVDERYWEQKFAELLVFKKQHGHCNVPHKYKPNPALNLWISTMRKIRKTGKLAAEREQRLEQVGFVWDPFESEWERRFEELLVFKEAHGHCDVPQKYKSNTTLGTWVGNMRTRHKTGKLAAAREQRLETAGFVWDPLESEWELRFEELLVFKEAQGHCNVPRTYKPNPALGAWVGAMRKNRKTGKLAADREQRLESAGFIWSRNDHSGSSSFPCPAVASSSAHDARDAAMCPCAAGIEVMNLSALD